MKYEEEIVEFIEPTELSAEMRQSLAESYAKDGFRKYLDNAINALRVKSSENAPSWEKVIEIRGQIFALKQLRYISRESYNDFNKLKKIAQRQRK